ncbi:MAG: hypothetical protein OEW19_22390, partial [Acidobacteriota bacterium]|nr:hypothetical protein [Acidobacteriota bacterium]
ALSLDREPRPLVRRLIAGACLLWMAVCAAGHVGTIRGFVADPPISRYRRLATYLDQHGAEYVEADYWIGYHVAFLTGERVKAITDFTRIHEHTLAVSAHLDRTWRVTRRPQTDCDDVAMVGDLYVCPPEARR